jgi:hypothetical protein
VHFIVGAVLSPESFKLTEGRQTFWEGKLIKPPRRRRIPDRFKAGPSLSFKICSKRFLRAGDMQKGKQDEKAEVSA